jgi:hypothetical protein
MDAGARDVHFQPLFGGSVAVEVASDTKLASAGEACCH